MRSAAISRVPGTGWGLWFLGGGTTPSRGRNDEVHRHRHVHRDGSCIQTLATATLSVKATVASGGFTALAGSGSGKNLGVIAVADGAEFVFGGIMNNPGKITLGGATATTELTVATGGATLNGIGHVTLSQDSNNEILAAAARTPDQRRQCYRRRRH